MKWVPSWIGESYARLYVDKHTGWFDSESAKMTLGITSAKSLSLRLTALETAGFLISKRDPVDRRRKYHRLIDPSDAIFSYGLRQSSKDVMGRLAAFSRHADLVIGGTYAAYVHTGYALPGKVDVYVDEDNKDRLISLLSDRSISVSIDDVLSEDIRQTNVHIHSSLALEDLDTVRIDDLLYHSPETLVIKGLVDQSESLLADAFALLLVVRSKLDFGKLLKMARDENVQRELTACMEIINASSRKRLFASGLIKKMHADMNTSRKKSFPRGSRHDNDEYRDIANRLNMRMTFPTGFVPKIMLDLLK